MVSIDSFFAYPNGRWFVPELNKMFVTHTLGRKGYNAALGRKGCGLQGDGKQFQPKCLEGSCTNVRWKDGSNERAVDRQQLRRAFGNTLILGSWPDDRGGGAGALQLAFDDSTLGGSIEWRERQMGSLTPFRRAMNAGDPFSKQNALPDSTIISNTPSNQVQGRLRRAANQAANKTAGSGLTTVVGGSAYTGNPKRVYDSSDYVRFKKLQAKNRNYNDPTFGGDDNFAAQTAIARVRH